jgi:hypothetical protein
MPSPHPRRHGWSRSAVPLDHAFTSTPRRWRITQLSMLVLAAGLAAAYAYAHPSPTVSFTGVVYDRGTKAPEADVLVTVDDGITAHTDASGAFSFVGLAPGKHAIKLTGGKLRTTVVTEAILPSEQDVDVKYAVNGQPAAGEEPDDLEVLVTPR